MQEVQNKDKMSSNVQIHWKMDGKNLKNTTEN